MASSLPQTPLHHLTHECNNVLTLIHIRTQLAKERYDRGLLTPQDIRDHLNHVQRLINDGIARMRMPLHATDSSAPDSDHAKASDAHLP